MSVWQRLFEGWTVTEDEGGVVVESPTHIYAIVEIDGCFMVGENTLQDWCHTGKTVPVVKGVAKIPEAIVTAVKARQFYHDNKKACDDILTELAVWFAENDIEPVEEILFLTSGSIGFRLYDGTPALAENKDELKRLAFVHGRSWLGPVAYHCNEKYNAHVAVVSGYPSVFWKIGLDQYSIAMLDTGLHLCKLDGMAMLLEQENPGTYLAVFDSTALCLKHLDACIQQDRNNELITGSSSGETGLEGDQPAGDNDS